LTAFYMTRVTYLTFNGQERFPSEKHPHESSALMTIPLWILAGLAILGGYVGIPALVAHAIHVPHWINDAWLSSDGGAGTSGLLANSSIMLESMHHHEAWELFLLPFSAILAMVMVWFAYSFYKKHDLAGDDKVRNFFGGFYNVMKGKFFVDEFYDAAIIRPFVWAGENIVIWFDKNIIDGVVNGAASTVASIGDVFKRLQTGLVSNYVFLVSAGVLVILSYLIFG
ncbi:MAG: hypothetical protein KDD63_24895, partial [Bacteroidetes bacterium]|nr:hypothetical protein [Bacteroidota bacterium]